MCLFASQTVALKTKLNATQAMTKNFIIRHPSIVPAISSYLTWKKKGLAKARLYFILCTDSKTTSTVKRFFPPHSHCRLFWYLGGFHLQSLKYIFQRWRVISPWWNLHLALFCLLPAVFLSLGNNAGWVWMLCYILFALLDDNLTNCNFLFLFFSISACPANCLSSRFFPPCCLTVIFGLLPQIVLQLCCKVYFYPKENVSLMLSNCICFKLFWPDLLGLNAILGHLVTP